MKLEGNLLNRLTEGKNYNNDDLIHEGDDITMSFYSDRECYYVTKVDNQKSIWIKPYQVVADHEKEGGCGHQNWLYFKTRKEANQYLNKIFKNKEMDENPKEYEAVNWVFRNNSWKRKIEWTLKSIIKMCEENYWDLEKYLNTKFTSKEIEKLREGKEVYKYLKLDGKISFGVRSYYYDWSF